MAQKNRVMDIHNRETATNQDAHNEYTESHGPAGTVFVPHTKHMIFTVWDPNSVQSDDNEICLWPEVDDDLTVSKITVTLDASGNEIAGDLKYADAFIGLANPVVINAFDTTSGILEDDSITSGSVAAGKAIYLSFDFAPDAAITQAAFDIEWSYD